MLSASFKKTIAVLALGCASVGAVSSVQAGNKMSQEQLQKLLTQEYIKKAEERARLQKQAQLRNEEARKKRPPYMQKMMPSANKSESNWPQIKYKKQQIRPQN